MVRSLASQKRGSVRSRCSAFQMRTRETGCLSYAVISEHLSGNSACPVQCTAKYLFRQSSSADILRSVRAQFLLIGADLIIISIYQPFSTAVALKASNTSFASNYARVMAFLNVCSTKVRSYHELALSEQRVVLLTQEFGKFAALGVYL